MIQAGQHGLEICNIPVTQVHERNTFKNMFYEELQIKFKKVQKQNGSEEAKQL